MRRRENADAIVELARLAGDPAAPAPRVPLPRRRRSRGRRHRRRRPPHRGLPPAGRPSSASLSSRWYVPLFRGMRALLAGDLERARAAPAPRSRTAAEATGSLNAEAAGRHARLGIARRRSAAAPRPDSTSTGSSTSIRRSGPAYAAGLADGELATRGDPDRPATCCELHAGNGFAPHRRRRRAPHHPPPVRAGRRRARRRRRRASDSTTCSRPHAGCGSSTASRACCWGPVDLELAGSPGPRPRASHDARGHLAEPGAADGQACGRRCCAADLDALQPPSLGATARLDRGGEATLGRRRGDQRVPPRGAVLDARLPGPDDPHEGRQGSARPRRLLAQPGREVHVLDLAGGAGDAAGAAAGSGDLGELLDARARAEYRRRLAELEERARRRRGRAATSLAGGAGAATSATSSPPSSRPRSASAAGRAEPATPSSGPARP